MYTTYLEAAYGLGAREEVFEIPLDSVTGEHLNRLAGRGELPRWPGVKNLTPQISAQFQVVAAAEAAKRGVARVHLDALWWA